MKTAEVRQIYVACDGRLKAVFRDGSVLLLSSGGTLFAVVKDGVVTRQTSDCAVSSLASRLYTAIEFRNMHLDNVVWCRTMSNRHAASLFSIGYPISHARWPAPCADGIASNNIEALSGGRVSVQSEDSTVRLVLHPHGKRFAVCFPLLVRKQDSEGSDACTFTYFWQHQTFSTADYPPRWRYPLSVAQAYMQQQSTPHTTPKLSSSVEHIADANDTVRALGASERSGSTEATPSGQTTANPGPAHSQSAAGRPENPQSDSNVTGTSQGAHELAERDTAAESRHSGEGQLSLCRTGQAGPSIRDRTTHLPIAVDAVRERPDFFKEGSWWTEYSPEGTPDDALIQMLWKPDLFAQFLPHTNEAEGWLCVDESYLATSHSGTFVRHLRGPGEDSVCRAGALPAHAWTADGTRQRYEFGRIVESLLEFRSRGSEYISKLNNGAATSGSGNALVKTHGGGAEASENEGPSILSSEVHRKQVAPGVGVFTAFQDGRVRVRFADRTLVSVDRWHRTADVLFRDGRRGTVSVTAPHGATEYITAVMEFAAWAFMTDEDRAAANEARRSVSAALDATQRMASLCEYSLTRQTPGAPALITSSAQHNSAGSMTARDDRRQRDAQTPTELHSQPGFGSHRDSENDAHQPQKQQQWATAQAQRLPYDSERFSDARTPLPAFRCDVESDGMVGDPCTVVPRFFKADAQASTVHQEQQQQQQQQQHQRDHASGNAFGQHGFTGVSFDQRESVVQEWLRKNADMLARLAD